MAVPYNSQYKGPQIDAAYTAIANLGANSEGKVICYNNTSKVLYGSNVAISDICILDDITGGIAGNFITYTGQGKVLQISNLNSRSFLRSIENGNVGNILILDKDSQNIYYAKDGGTSLDSILQAISDLEDEIDNLHTVGVSYQGGGIYSYDGSQYYGSLVTSGSEHAEVVAVGEYIKFTTDVIEVSGDDIKITAPATRLVNNVICL